MPRQRRSSSTGPEQGMTAEQVFGLLVGLGQPQQETFWELVYRNYPSLTSSLCPSLLMMLLLKAKAEFNIIDRDYLESMKNRLQAFTHEPKQSSKDRMQRIRELVCRTTLTPGQIGIKLKEENPKWCRKKDKRPYEGKYIEKLVKKDAELTITQIRQRLMLPHAT
jgi:hypothetical protein